MLSLGQTSKKACSGLGGGKGGYHSLLPRICAVFPASAGDVQETGDHGENKKCADTISWPYTCL